MPLSYEIAFSLFFFPVSQLIFNLSLQFLWLWCVSRTEHLSFLPANACSLARMYANEHGFPAPIPSHTTCTLTLSKSISSFSNLGTNSGESRGVHEYVMKSHRAKSALQFVFVCACVNAWKASDTGLKQCDTTVLTRLLHTHTHAHRLQYPLSDCSQ